MSGGGPWVGWADAASYRALRDSHAARAVRVGVAGAAHVALDTGHDEERRPLPGARPLPLDATANPARDASNAPSNPPPPARDRRARRRA
ncbi:hypothetical protein, partial [Burkholderia gladioli]|uniref:hypothetical protein n=1 Tax=Burkholderia gladioli TaxID=28095 RepID=UPI0019D6E368